MDEPYINSPEEEDEGGEFIYPVHISDLPIANGKSIARFNESSIDPSLGSNNMGHGLTTNDTADDRQFFTDIARSATSLFTENGLQTPETASELVKAFAVHEHKREWPEKNVTEETLDDAYVNFVFCCNPSIPLSQDSMELRRAFRMPPKSDGNTFSTFKLLKLIEKFEEGEIKTWTKLATDLGVERKDDQSTQKIQQYAVRLKRWMHAMHIDAFFEYCFGKSHVYYNKIPKNSMAPPDGLRDGVPVEEDLALRALIPETRPKRGRRKLDDRGSATPTPTEDDRPAKRINLDATPPNYTDDNYNSNPILFQQTPQSALSNTLDHEISRYLEPVTPEQWSAATAAALSATMMTGPDSASPHTGSAGSQTFRWRAFQEKTSSLRASPQQHIYDNEETVETPITPSTANTNSPASARSRTRRRHGPAVSSAWPSSGNAGTGKLRGRPPSNRTVQDGPYSTFPANPQGKPGPVAELIRQNSDLMRQNEPTRQNSISDTPSNTPILNSAFNGSAGTPSSTPIVGAQNQFTMPSKDGRPKPLHVQIPIRHSTFPMALKEQSATMSPHVRMNDIIDRMPFTPRRIIESLDFADISARDDQSQVDMSSTLGDSHQVPTISPQEDLLAIEQHFASKLMFATSEDNNISPAKARSVSAAIIAGMRKHPDLKNDSASLAKVAAACLGRETGMRVSYLKLKNEPNRPNLMSRHSDPGTLSNEADHDAFSEQLLETYTVTWNISVGTTMAAYESKVSIPYYQGMGHEVEMSPIEEVDDIFSGMGGDEGTPEADAGVGDNDVSWREKCALLEEQLKKSKEDLESLKKGIMQSVMGSG